MIKNLDERLKAKQKETMRWKTKYNIKIAEEKDHHPHTSPRSSRRPPCPDMRRTPRTPSAPSPTNPVQIALISVLLVITMQCH